MTLQYHVIQLSALLANSLRRSRKARTANKISLGNYGEHLPQRASPLLRSYFKVDMVTCVGGICAGARACVCICVCVPVVNSRPLPL